MGKFFKKIGTSFLRNRLNQDKNVEGSKNANAAKAVANELADEAKKHLAKKIVLKVATFSLPIIGPVILIIIAAAAILMPMAYGFMMYSGTFETFARDILLTAQTNVWVSFEGWFHKEEGTKYIEGTTAAYENFLEERFIDLNNDLLKAYSKKEASETLGTEDTESDSDMTPEEANEVKTYALSWIYTKIYNDYFKTTISEDFFHFFSGQAKSTAPELKPLQETVLDIYVPGMTTNVEDVRKKYFNDDVNLYDIEAFDFLSGTLMDLMDLDIDALQKQTIVENKKIIEKKKEEKQLEVYKSNAVGIINSMGIHINNVINKEDWNVKGNMNLEEYVKSKSSVSIRNSINLKGLSNTDRIIEYLYETSEYISNPKIKKLRQDLQAIDSKVRGDSNKTDEVVDIIIKKSSDFKTLIDLATEFDSSLKQYIISLVPAKEISSTEKEIALYIDKYNAYDTVIAGKTDVLNKNLASAIEKAIEEGTEEKITASIKQAISDLELSRTQQAAIYYRDRLIDVETYATVDYYSLNLGKGVFADMMDLPSYTADYAIKQGKKGKYEKDRSKDKDKNKDAGDFINNLSDIRNTFYFENSTNNPIVMAIDNSSGTDYYQGQLESLVSAIAGGGDGSYLKTKLKEVEFAKDTLEAIKTSYESGIITPEIEEIKKEISDEYWEPARLNGYGLTSNAYYYFLYANDWAGMEKDNNSKPNAFTYDLANKTTDSDYWRGFSGNIYNRGTYSLIDTEADDMGGGPKNIMNLDDTGNVFASFTRYLKNNGMINESDKPDSPSVMNYYYGFNNSLIAFNESAQMINLVNSDSDITKKKINKYFEDAQAYLAYEAGRINTMIDEVNGVLSITPGDSSNFIVPSNIRKITKAGVSISNDNDEYVVGNNTLNIKRFKNTREEAVKLTARKHFSDVIKQYKTKNSKGRNIGNVDISVDVPEQMGGITLAPHQTEFLKAAIPLAVKTYGEFGVLPSIIMAQAIEESGWGNLAKNNVNNIVDEGYSLFGMRATSGWDGKVVDASTGTVYNSYSEASASAVGELWRAYDSWEESFRNHSEMLTGQSNFAGVTDGETYEEQLRVIVEGHYFVDSRYPEDVYEQNYFDTISGMIEMYELFNYDGYVMDTSSSGEAGLNYHENGRLKLWKEYFIDNESFTNTNKLFKEYNIRENKNLNGAYSDIIIGDIDKIDSRFKKELAELNISNNEIKAIVAATLNVGLYRAPEGSSIVLSPRFTIKEPTITNSRTVVEGIANRYLEINREIGGKDIGFTIYLYTLDNPELEIEEIKKFEGTFAEYIEGKYKDEAESFISSNPYLIKTAQILSGDILVDVSDFFALNDIIESDDTASSSTKTPIDMYYEDWVDAKYMFHEMYNALAEDGNEVSPNTYEYLDIRETLNSSLDNSSSNIEGTLTITNSKGDKYTITIKKNYLEKASQKIGSIKHIVIHDTGFMSSFESAESQYEKFNKENPKETMHYVVDDKEAWHYVDNAYEANHINDKATAQGGTRTEVNNTNSLGVQLSLASSADKSDTFWHTVGLVKHLMDTQGVSIDEVILHNDVTGVQDSQYMLDNSKEKWIEFKEALKTVKIEYTPYTVGSGALGNDVVSIAKSLIGNPYVWGGNGEIITEASMAVLRSNFASAAAEGYYDYITSAHYNGQYRAFDCSSFVQYVYAQLGISISRVTTSQMSDGSPVFAPGESITESKLKPGDLLVNAEHVVMWIGNGEYIHSPYPGAFISTGRGIPGGITHVRRLL